MESSNRKRRGFLKGKLMPFYPTSKVKLPNQMSSYSNSSTGLLIQQDYVFAPPKPKVTFVLPDNARDSVARYEEVCDMTGGDETVDARAATYISYVQERFKLDRMNSERMKHQDQMQF